MSTLKNNAATKVDPALERLAQEQREFNASNRPLQAGMAAAQSQARQNEWNSLQGEIGRVKRMAVEKDTSQAKLDQFNRVYSEMMRLAQAWASGHGESIEVPVRDVFPGFPLELHAWVRDVAAVLAKHKIEIPPLPTPAKTILVTPAVPKVDDDSAIRARKLAEKAAGLTPGVPGSAQNDSWLNLQGTVK